MQIHDIINSAIEAKRRVDGIDGNVTFNEAKAIKGEFSSKFEELVEAVVPRLTESLMAIVKEYPALWDFQRIRCIVPGIPYEVLCGSSTNREEIEVKLGKSLRYFNYDVKPEYLELSIGGIPESLILHEEHGSFMSIPVSLLDDGFDPRTDGAVAREVENANALRQWNSIFGGDATVSSVASAVKILRILNKYPECVRELSGRDM